MTLPTFPIPEMFTTLPDYTEFDQIPQGTDFHSRRGLPYRKTGIATAQTLWHDDDVSDEELAEADVFDDWPYWEAP